MTKPTKKKPIASKKRLYASFRDAQTVLIAKAIRDSEKKPVEDVHAKCREELEAALASEAGAYESSHYWYKQYGNECHEHLADVRFEKRQAREKVAVAIILTALITTGVYLGVMLI